MVFVFAGSAPLRGASLWITQLMSATEWRAPSNERTWRSALRSLAVLAVDRGRRHADGVVACIDIVDRAGDAGAEVGQQVEPRTTDIGQLDIAPQGRGLARHAVDVACTADHRAGQGAHRPGRDRVHPHALRAEIGRE